MNVEKRKGRGKAKKTYKVTFEHTFFVLADSEEEAIEKAEFYKELGRDGHQQDTAEIVDNCYQDVAENRWEER